MNTFDRRNAAAFRNAQWAYDNAEEPCLEDDDDDLEEDEEE